jgi:hypothetical protein
MTFMERALVMYCGLATSAFTVYAGHNLTQYLMTRPYYCLSCGKPMGRDGKIMQRSIQKEDEQVQQQQKC